MKKIDVDRHTGPIFTFLVLVGLCIFVAYFAPMLGAIIIGFVALWFVPFFITAIWNKFIATEDDFYD